MTVHYQIKSFIFRQHGPQKDKTQKHTNKHKQTEGQTEKKQTTSTNYRLTTSTTLTPTHHSVNTVLSLKRLTIELPHKNTLL